MNKLDDISTQELKKELYRRKNNKKIKRAIDIHKLADAEFAEYLLRKRKCTKCLLTKTIQDFNVTSCRGKPMFRAWCSQCAKEYYREYSKAKRMVK